MKMEFYVYKSWEGFDKASRYRSLMSAYVGFQFALADMISSKNRYKVVLNDYVSFGCLACGKDIALDQVSKADLMNKCAMHEDTVNIVLHASDFGGYAENE